MKQRIKFIRIVGGKSDGDLQKLTQPVELDKDEVADIESDGEAYRLDRITDETAVFIHVGFTKSLD